MARALAVADASAIAPFEFLRLPYAAFLGFAIFGEQPDAWTCSAPPSSSARRSTSRTARRASRGSTRPR